MPPRPRQRRRPVRGLTRANLRILQQQLGGNENDNSHRNGNCNYNCDCKGETAQGLRRRKARIKKMRKCIHIMLQLLASIGDKGQRILEEYDIIIVGDNENELVHRPPSGLAGISGVRYDTIGLNNITYLTDALKVLEARCKHLAPQWLQCSRKATPAEIAADNVTSDATLREYIEAAKARVAKERAVAPEDVERRVAQMQYAGWLSETKASEFWVAVEARARNAEAIAAAIPDWEAWFAAADVDAEAAAAAAAAAAEARAGDGDSGSAPDIDAMHLRGGDAAVTDSTPRPPRNDAYPLSYRRIEHPDSILDLVEASQGGLFAAYMSLSPLEVYKLVESGSPDEQEYSYLLLAAMLFDERRTVDVLTARPGAHASKRDRGCCDRETPLAKRMKPDESDSDMSTLAASTPGKSSVGL